jgi:hypothetical protein
MVQYTRFTIDTSKTQYFDWFLNNLNDDRFVMMN